MGAAVLAGSLSAACIGRRHAAVTLSSRASALAELLPSDLDVLSSPTIISALGVQLLLFGGFTHDASIGGGWRRGTHPPASLLERTILVSPTWKPEGRVDYTWPGDGGLAAPPSTAPLSLFAAAEELAVATHHPTTVHSLAHALEHIIGLDASDFDDDARRALREMLAWRVPSSAKHLAPLSSTADVAVLAFSFGAAGDSECVSVAQCSHPGPANELLAATADAFVRHRQQRGQRVTLIAQWEIAAALHNLGTPGVVAVGTPGIFENTARIYEHMLAHVQGSGACEPRGTDREPAGASVGSADDSAGRSTRLVVLAHPDHLRRALRIGETTFARAALGGPCREASIFGSSIVPAMAPYHVDWPWDSSTAAHGARGGSTLNLFAGASGHVHTNGSRRDASWYEPPNGFFADDPQPWVRRREVWLCYEFWARAKGVATGIIATRA